MSKGKEEPKIRLIPETVEDFGSSRKEIIFKSSLTIPKPSHKKQRWELLLKEFLSSGEEAARFTCNEHNVSKFRSALQTSAQHLFPEEVRIMRRGKYIHLLRLKK